MLKLRILLLSDKLYLILTAVIFILSFIYCQFNNYHSKYNGSEKEITGYITNLKTDGNKVTMEVKCKEKLIIIYYAKSKQDINDIKTNYNLGDRFIAKGKLNMVKDNSVFNLFNYKKYLSHKKIFYLFTVTNLKKIKDNNKVIYTMKQIIVDRITTLKYSSSGVLAFALGDSSLTNSDIMQTYQTNGITHLLALSGANVALLALVLLFILKLFKITEIKRYIIVIIFLFLYTFMANYSASIVRATFFFSLLATNKVFYFNIKPFNVLLLTFLILLIINPYYLYDLGFQFSFVISFYLILFQTYITASKNSLVTLYRVSLLSFLVSMPITIYNFCQINLLSIIYNLFFVPLVSFIIYPLSLIVIIIPFFDYPLSLFINLMEVTSLLVDQITISKLILAKPNLLVVILYYLVITIILINLQKNNYKPLIILLVMLVIHANCAKFNPYPTLTMIDVGQGDSFLLQLPHDKGNILIDTGGKLLFEQKDYQIKKRNYSTTINTIIPYLKSLGINKLDYLILTHGDDDHMGEAVNLINNFKVNTIILNDYNLTPVEQRLLKTRTKDVYFYHSGDQIKINNTKLYFLNPSVNLNENDNSLVIYLQLYKYRLLFMGDASTTIENKLINKYNLTNIDILKIGHHGSSTSTSNIFLDTIKPKYALISVAQKNNFGHPNPSVIKELNERNIRIYQTSKQGSLRIIFKPQQLLFLTCN